MSYANCVPRIELKGDAPFHSWKIHEGTLLLPTARPVPHPMLVNRDDTASVPIIDITQCQIQRHKTERYSAPSNVTVLNVYGDGRTQL